MHENDISGIVVNVAFQIHNQLGPGLLESVYSTIMFHALPKRGLRVQKEVPLPVHWDSLKMDIGFRADFIIENAVVIELKSVEAINPVHKKQLLTYLKLTDCRLGLLINFNTDLIKNGISRIVNGLDDSPRR